MMATIMDVRFSPARNATTTPPSPAYHAEEKSVRARGNINDPRAAVGNSSIAFLMTFGSLSSELIY